MDSPNMLQMFLILYNNYIFNILLYIQYFIFNINFQHNFFSQKSQFLLKIIRG